MPKKIFLGAILGGLVAFIWGWISWTMLPWHDATFRSFTDGDAITAAIKANAPNTGVYLLPNMPPDSATATPEQKQAAHDAWAKRYAEGPSGILAIKTEGTASMGPALVGGLVLNVLAAALLTWLLIAGGPRAYALKVVFIVVVALFATVVSHLTSWNWWGVAIDYTSVMVADTLVTWLLAGFVIAWAAR